MRKILLATTALVGAAFAGAAHAAESPIAVNVGGYVDFRAGFFHEADNNNSVATGSAKRAARAFENEFQLNVDAVGKAANGIQYGADVSLWNGAEVNDSYTGGSNNVRLHKGTVWLSGAWGKAVFGNAHSAAVDMFVSAPTVGEGQIDGTFTDFTDPTTLTVLTPFFGDDDEHGTKISYYTPKVGSENHKFQLGASYEPNQNSIGQSVVKYTSSNVTNGTANSPYQDIVSGAGQYTGNWGFVNGVATAFVTSGAAQGNYTTTAAGVTGPYRDYTSAGLGAQFTRAGVTVGGSYVDAGRFGTVQGQNKPQEVYTLGAKYEFDKVAVAANYLGGKGYNNAFAQNGSLATNGTNQNYVRHLNEIGFGATYTWFPGLTTAADAVFFHQNRGDVNGSGVAFDKNEGHVLMLTQKLTF